MLTKPHMSPGASMSILYVNGLARSGTTALMSLLSCGKNVALPGSYPYELRIASYLSSVYHVLKDRAEKEEPWIFEDRLLDKLAVPFPFYHEELLGEWHQSSFRPLLRQAFASSLESLAWRLLGESGCKSDKIWWLEKFPSVHEEDIIDLFGCFNMLVLLRNPVDVAVSRFIANQHGIPSDMWFLSDNNSVLSIFENALAASIDLLSADGEVLQRGGSSMIVRYEDLISQPLYQIQAIARKFGITCDDLDIDMAIKHSSDLKKIHTSSISSDYATVKRSLLDSLGDNHLLSLSKIGY